MSNNLPKCCLDFDIDIIDFIFLDRMTPEGREFLDARGVLKVSMKSIRENATDLGEGKIKIRHRCQQLGDDGKCAIYEHRPVICRQFDCALRHDCACMGKGVIE